MFEKCVLVIGVLFAGVMVVEARELAPAIGDPIKGKTAYAQCMGCHSPERHRTGPKHCGLIGRRAGTAAGFEYSKAMLEADVIWGAETLDQFLYAPLDFIPGTSMGIAGIKKDVERRDLIAYLTAINEQDECN